MTQVIAEPEPITTVEAAQLSRSGHLDQPEPITTAEDATCTAGHAWCNGECDEEDPYHLGVVAWLTLLRFTPSGWQDREDTTLIVRHDENEGDDSQPLIMLDYPSRDCTPGMTPAQARQNAAWLLNAADMLDPLPAGAMVTTAVHVRIGDELLTEDGWQKVTGLLFSTDNEQASIFTPERGADMDADSEGWDLSLHDVVKVRRPLTGSCAIQFVEPITGGTR